MAVRYRSEFKSTEGRLWRIDVADSTHVGDPDTFKVASNGFELNYRSENQEINAPILGSQLRFAMQLEDSGMADFPDDIANGAENRFTVVLYDFPDDEATPSFFWCGVIDSQVTEEEDMSFPRDLVITAVDGIALLKDIEYKATIAALKWQGRYVGFDGLVQIIARCLQKLPHIQLYENLFEKFLVTAINTYSEEIAPSSLNDPLFYSEIDNQAFAEGQTSGNAKFLSCYDVLKEILLAFEARIMLTNGYFLIEELEHRLVTIGTNNWSRYYEYDVAEPFANTLPAPQDISPSGDSRRIRGGSYSFLPALKKVRVKQRVDAMRNLFQGLIFDENEDSHDCGTSFFESTGFFNVIKLSGTIQVEYTSLAPPPLAGNIVLRFAFVVQVTSGGTDYYLNRDVTTAGSVDKAGATTWGTGGGENFELTLKVENAQIPDEDVTASFSLPIDIYLPRPPVDYGDVEAQLAFQSVRLLVADGSVFSSGNYSVAFTFQNAYFACVQLKNGFQQKDLVWQALSSEDSNESMEFPVLVGSLVEGAANQIGALLYNEAGDYSRMGNWAIRGGTPNKPLSRLLAERLLNLRHTARRTLRCTVYGAGFEWRDPVDDGDNVYLLRSGTFNAGRDEFSGEWFEGRIGALEITTTQEVDDGTSGGTVPSAGGSGTTSGGNGGVGGGGGSDGNGIYSGSGDVPDATVAALLGSFGFSSDEPAAEFFVNFDDGESVNLLQIGASGILLQSTNDTIDIEGVTRFTDILSPATISANQNDYAALDGANVGRLNASSGVNVTGIDSGIGGRLLFILNRGALPITLTNADTSSAAASRLDSGRAFAVRGKKGALLIYDDVDNKWLMAAIGDLSYFDEGYTTSTATTASLTADTPATNIGIAICPKGSGAFMLDIPDAAGTGGNARGTNAIDLQTDRSAADQVASGANSAVVGGRRNKASGTYSATVGGSGNTASGSGAVALGGSGAFNVGVTATGDNSFAFGTGADATATSAVAFLADASAQNAVAMLQNANKYGQFATFAVSFIRWSRLVVGTSATELFLDGTSLKATVDPNTRWQFEISVFARTTVVGNGTGALNDMYFASFVGVIRNTGGTTALLGTVDALMAAKTDASMSDAAFAITADDTGDYLKVVFTPPSTAGSTSQYTAGAAMKWFQF